MTDASVYDDDILEWSEQQAAVLRDLARTRRDLPNELDLENVAEEIECVGRSEFVAVQSLVRQILIHLIKAVSVPDATALLHWRKEVAALHRDILDHLSPSMRTRINIARLWSQAIKQAELDLAAHGQALAQQLPAQCPLNAEYILDSNFDFVRAVEALHDRMAASD